MRKLKSGRFSDIFGVLCLTAAVMITLLADWQQVKKPTVVGLCVSLAWVALSTIVSENDSEVFETIALFLGLAGSALLIDTRALQQRFMSGLLPCCCYLVVLGGMCWLCRKLAALVRRPPREPPVK